MKLSKAVSFSVAARYAFLQHVAMFSKVKEASELLCRKLIGGVTERLSSSVPLNASLYSRELE